MVFTLSAFALLALEDTIVAIAPSSWTKHLWKPTHFLFTTTLLLEVFVNGVFWFGMYPFALINLWGKVSAIDILLPAI